MLKPREHKIGENAIGWPQLRNQLISLWHAPYVDDDLEMELVEKIWQRIEQPNAILEFGMHRAIGHHEIGAFYA